MVIDSSVTLSLFNRDNYFNNLPILTLIKKRGRIAFNGLLP
jgi:hypothetical protein